MSRVHLRRAHALEIADAHARVSRAATRLTERFGARCRWENEVLHIEHASVAGLVTLKSREIVVEAELRFPLALLRGRAEAEIARILDAELAP